MPNPLTKKAGPLPIWGWGLVVGGGYVLYRYIRPASTVTTSSTGQGVVPAGSDAAAVDSTGAAISQLGDALTQSQSDIFAALTSQAQDNATQQAANAAAIAAAQAQAAAAEQASATAAANLPAAIAAAVNEAVSAIPPAVAPLPVGGDSGGGAGAPAAPPLEWAGHGIGSSIWSGRAYPNLAAVVASTGVPIEHLAPTETSPGHWVVIVR